MMKQSDCPAEGQPSRCPGPGTRSSVVNQPDGWSPWHSGVNIISPCPAVPRPARVSPSLPAPSSAPVARGPGYGLEVDELLGSMNPCSYQLPVMDCTGLKELGSELHTQLADAHESLEHISADFTSSMVGMSALMMSTAADADRLRADCSRLQASLQATSRDLTAEKLLRREAQRTAQHSMAAAADHLQRVQQLEQQVSDLLADQHMLHTQQQATAAALDAARREMIVARQQAAVAEEQQAALKQQAATAKEREIAAKQQATAAQQNATIAKQEAAAEQQQIAATQLQNINALNNELSQLQQQQRELQETARAAEGQAAAQQQQVASLGQDLRQLQQQHSVLQQQLSDLQETLASAQQQGAAAAADRELLANKVLETEAAMQQMTADCSRLQQELLQAKAIAAKASVVKFKRGPAGGAALAADCRVVTEAFEHLQTLQHQQDQVKGLKGFLSRQQLQKQTKAALEDLACAVQHMASTAGLVRRPGSAAL